MPKKKEKKEKKEKKKDPRSPSEVIEDLAPAYLGWKSNEKDKNKFKDEFFEGITIELAQGELAEEVVTIEAKDEEQALDLISKGFPMWITEDVRPHPDEDGTYEVIIKENPAYLPFTIEFGEKVWGRQIASGSQMLDDERLIDEDPHLWYQVTEFPNQEFLLALLAEDDEALEQEKIEHIERVGENFGIQRQLKSLNDIPEELQPKLQKYIYEGKPVTKLPAPKKAESD